MITLIYGNNFYKRQVNLKKIISDFAGKYGSENIERQDGENLELQQFIELSIGLSLFSTNKLVIIRSLSASKNTWEYLGENAGEIEESTHLVLIEDMVDKRLKTYKTLQKQANIIECLEPSESQLILWVISTAEEKGKKIDQKLAYHLIRRSGGEQSSLYTEIEKICLLESQVTTEIIDNIVEATPEGNVFELIDTVLVGNPGKLKLLLSQQKYNEDPYRLFGLFTSQIFNLARVKASSELSERQLASEIGLHPYVASKLKSAASKMSMNELKQISKEVALLDDRLKLSSADPWDLLEHTLVKISAR